MKVKAIVAAVAALSASAAFAAPTFTVPGGQMLDPFGGIDWAPNGTVFTTTFDQARANRGETFQFDSTYFAYAVPTSGIQQPNGVNFTVPNLVGGGTASLSGPQFELTTVATFRETANCAVGGNCNFTINGGNFDIYLDTAANARVGEAANLNQYRDGARIIGGEVNQGAPSVIVGNRGFFGLDGRVTFTNSAFISPELLGTSATSTLQLGNARTAYVEPGFCSSSGSGTGVRSCLAFQADANQSFTFGRVPEPGTLALLGASVLGLGFGARRRTAR